MTPPRRLAVITLGFVCTVAVVSPGQGAGPQPPAVEGQPLAANVERVLVALNMLGAPPAAETAAKLHAAAKARDARALQELLDPLALVVVTLNPEARVKAARSPAPATLQQGGFVPVLVKVVN